MIIHLFDKSALIMKKVPAYRLLLQCADADARDMLLTVKKLDPVLQEP
jgi:hypothetical protein